MSSTYSPLKWRNWRWAPAAISATALESSPHSAKEDRPDEKGGHIAFSNAENDGAIATLRRKFSRSATHRGFLGTDWSNNASYPCPLVTDSSDGLILGTKRSAP